MDYGAFKNLLDVDYSDRTAFDAYVKYIENDIRSMNELYKTFGKENEKMFKIGDFVKVNYIEPEYLERAGENAKPVSPIEGAVGDIDRVIYNDPATIVLWKDGTKTVVKCGDGDIFDPEKGLAMAIAKKALGNKSQYYDIFKKHLPKSCSEPRTRRYRCGPPSGVRIDIGETEIHSDETGVSRCSFYVFVHYPDGNMARLKMGMAVSDLLCTDRKCGKQKFDFLYVFIKDPDGGDRYADASISDDIYYAIIEEAKKHFNHVYGADKFFWR